MKSHYRDEEAAHYVERFQAAGEDVALRVYTSRLIGRDPSLVMHGGGNTSVKGAWRNILGEEVPAIFVKGSGWNLDSIEPPGFPGLDLEYLKKLRALDALSDEEMVNQLRTHMFDASGPNPSVETLLHAFLPHKVIDHSHADAILALTNRPDGEALIRELYGERVGIVPYVMPGFALAKICAEVFESNPEVEGLVLLKHGLFSFGDDARQSYERHVSLVSAAENWLSKHQSRGLTPRFDAPADAATLCAKVAPVLRGLLAEATGEPDVPYKRMVLEWRATDEILDFVNAAELETLVLTGPLTPDHVIRTKALPLVIAEPDFDDIEEQLNQAVTAYRRAYNDYFDRMVGQKNVERVRLDDFPRVVLIPGVGMLAWGGSKKDARIAADIYEHTIRVKALVHATGEYEALPEADLFDVEYWSLEQAKLKAGAQRAAPLKGQIAVVTGAAGAIGSAVAECLIEAGAHVVLSDIHAEKLSETCEYLGERYGKDARRGVVSDVTDEHSVSALFDEVARLYGGADIIVPNAGVAHSRPLDELESADWQRVLDVNLTGYFHVMREAARLLKEQGTGGNIVAIGSKNTMAPGAEFGAYSASKAAGHQLAKVAALELAKEGVRVNVIAPDAVFGDERNPSGLWDEVGPDRAKAHGIDFAMLEEHYRNRNLLRARVTGRHVGNAVVFFATNRTPTTGATLPVDGGIANAFPR